MLIDPRRGSIQGKTGSKPGAGTGAMATNRARQDESDSVIRHADRIAGIQLPGVTRKHIRPHRGCQTIASEPRPLHKDSIRAPKVDSLFPARPIPKLPGRTQNQPASRVAPNHRRNLRPRNIRQQSQQKNRIHRSVQSLHALILAGIAASVVRMRGWIVAGRVSDLVPCSRHSAAKHTH